MCFACVYAHTLNRISKAPNSSLCKDWILHACPSVFLDRENEYESVNLVWLWLWLNTYIPSVPAAICYRRENHLPQVFLSICLFIASFLYDTGNQHAMIPTAFQTHFFPLFAKQILIIRQHHASPWQLTLKSRQVWNSCLQKQKYQAFDSLRIQSAVEGKSLECTHKKIIKIS